MTVAAISGGSSPCAKASPQPLTPSSVRTSTMVAERWRTQPCENANGSASALFNTWIRISVIFILYPLAGAANSTLRRVMGLHLFDQCLDLRIARPLAPHSQNVRILG